MVGFTNMAHTGFTEEEKTYLASIEVPAQVTPQKVLIPDQFATDTMGRPIVTSGADIEDTILIRGDEEEEKAKIPWWLLLIGAAAVMQ